MCKSQRSIRRWCADAGGCQCLCRASKTSLVQRAAGAGHFLVELGQPGIVIHKHERDEARARCVIRHPQFINSFVRSCKSRGYCAWDVDIDVRDLAALTSQSVPNPVYRFSEVQDACCLQADMIDHSVPGGFLEFMQRVK